MTQLTRDPPNDNPAEQAVHLPKNVLTDIKEAAKKAILQIAPAEIHDIPYSSIRQRPTEPFSSFVDRLMQAIDRQVVNQQVKQPLTKSLAFGNANPDCQQVISTMQSRPTLADMLEACSKVETPQHVTSIVKEELKRE